MENGLLMVYITSGKPQDLAIILSGYYRVEIFKIIFTIWSIIQYVGLINLEQNIKWKKFIKF